MNKRGASFGERVVMVGLTAQIVFCFGAVLHRMPQMVLVNESHSIPRGVYVRAPNAPVRRGAVVAVHQPARARAYLARLGAPDDMLLIKHVAARAGDVACSEGDVVRLPGRQLAVRSQDRLGSPMPRWTGCRRLDVDEVFVVGDTPTSFDSRYFGPVRTDQVEGVFREVARW